MPSHSEHQAALTRLMHRTQESLAAFILSLTHHDGPVAEHARTFITGDNLPATIHALHTRIMALRRPPHRDHERRFADNIGQRLDYILDAIESLILPIDTIAAFSLLLMAIESDGPTMESCGDHHDDVSTAIHRAIELIVKIVPNPPPLEALAALTSLATHDDYGTRTPLAQWLNSRAPKA